MANHFGPMTIPQTIPTTIMITPEIIRMVGTDGLTVGEVGFEPTQA